MYLCPICRKNLQKNKTATGIVHDCPNGHGRSISLYIIKNNIEKELFRKFQQAISAEHRSSRIVCPVCEKKMKGFPLALGGEEIELDVCKRCYLLWFDQGELERLPVIAAQGKLDSLSVEDREKMAVAETKLIAESEKFRDDHASEEPEEEWKMLPGLMGMPVEYGTQAFRSVPWVTWTIAGILILVSLLTIGRLESVVYEFGLIPAESFRYGGLTILTSFFLHAGLIHLLGNVYFLWIFGDNVEDVLGKKRFLLLLFCATIAGDLSHIAFNEGSSIPCVGASGGISGIIVCYALLFPQARLGLMFNYGGLYYSMMSERMRWWVKFPAWGGVLIWIAIQILGSYYQLLGLDNVSYIAHLGGAAVGVAAWVLWREKIE